MNLSGVAGLTAGCDRHGKLGWTNQIIWQLNGKLTHPGNARHLPQILHNQCVTIIISAVSKAGSEKSLRFRIGHSQTVAHS
jgi:hypothetical protein